MRVMSEYPPPLWFLDPKFKPKAVFTKEVATSLGVCHFCQKAGGNHKTPTSKWCLYSKESRENLTRRHHQSLASQPEDDTHVASNVNEVLDPSHNLEESASPSLSTRSSPRHARTPSRKRLIEEIGEPTPQRFQEDSFR